MQRPVNITFRGMDASDAVRARILKKAQWLNKFYDRLISCEVVIQAPHQHSRKGKLFSVTVEMRVPGGPPLVAGRLRHNEHGHEDAYVAIRDTFDAARRMLQAHAAKLRGDVKIHEIPPHGTVSWLAQNDRYGFIDSSDGTEVYFHENALVDTPFDRLKPGDEVWFAMHEAEGAKGPQASTVRRVGKHRPVA